MSTPLYMRELEDNFLQQRTRNPHSAARPSHACPMHDLFLTRESNDLTLLEHVQASFQGMLRKSLLRDKLAYERLIACTPSDWQASSEFLFDAVNFLVQFRSCQALDGASGNGVHGGEFEEANGLVNVVR